MGSEVCAARIETLKGFADAGLQGRLDVDAQLRVNRVTADWGAMEAACPFRAIKGNPGPQVTTVLDQLRTNEGWVAGIATALDNAPTHGGVSALDSSKVEAALTGQGLAAPDTTTVTFDPQQMVGSPVTSGFVNDPVNAATGNFVHGDRDLRFPGFGAVLDVVRVYNSFNAGRVGVFGRGWTSPLDVRLDVTGAAAGVVRLAFTDGAVVPFTRAADESGWTPDRRRRLRLTVTADGWEVSRHNGRRRWSFDPDGNPTGGAEGRARWSVTEQGDTTTPGAITGAGATSDDGSVTWTEELSGRWVRYQLDGGLVRSLRASDGRSCTYRYDGDGNCVAVERVIGDLIYELDDQGFVAGIVDADGVRSVANTYDPAGRVVAQQAPHGRRSRLEYLPNGATRVTDEPADEPADGGGDDGDGATNGDGPGGGDGPNLLIHDRAGNLTALFGSDGTAMRAAYDHHDRIVRHTARDGAVTRYDYHPDPHLDLITRRTDPDGLAETHTHDPLGRMVERVDRSGAPYRYTYEGDRPNPSVVDGPEGSRITIAYDDRDLPVSITDADGVTTGFAWNGDGQVAAVVNGNGDRTRFTYDPTGQLLEVTDPAGHRAHFELDPAGRVATTTGPDGLTDRYTWSPAGRTLARTGPGSGSWTATYGPHGDLSAFTDGAGATVAFGHDHCGRVTAVTAPDGTITRQEWDGLGLLTAVVDPAGNRATQTHDRAGRSIAVTHYDGRTWQRETDPLGRTTAVTGPDGTRTTRTYHPSGHLASVTGPTGNTWTFEVDALGRLTAETDPGGGRHRFEYTAGSRLARQISPAGRVHTYRYDRAGRLSSVTDPDGVAATLTRGPDGHIRRLAVGDQQVELDLDDGGRVRRWTGSPDGVTGTIDWAADSTSLAVGIGPDDPADYGFDPRALLDRVTDPSGILTHLQHDIRGRITGATTGSAGPRLAYDPSGAPAGGTDADGFSVTWRNTRAGRLEAVLFGPTGSGLGRAYRYDPAGRVVAVDRLDGGPLATFGYDANGFLTRATTPTTELALEHDHNGLLTAVTGQPGTRARYAYDADGLVVARLDEADRRTGYVRSPAGRILGFDDTDAGPVAAPSPTAGVTWDRAGRIVADGHGRSYAYDRAGRLDQARNPDGTAWRFTWNDLGLLATETHSSPAGPTRRTFTWTVGGRLTAITITRPDDTTGSTALSHDAAGRRLTEQHSDGSRVDYGWDDLDRLRTVTRTDPAGRATTRHITHDALGRVTAVDSTPVGWDDALTGKPVQIGASRHLRSGWLVRPATPGGTWADGTGDDPWGTDTPVLADPADPGVGLGYRGELTVDGLVFMGDRVYDPTTRTFLSRDPLPPVPGANSAFTSPYTYAWCDPVNHLDPTGRQPVTIEEYNDWKAKQETNRFEKAGQAMVDDPWGTVAMVGVVAVGAALVATGVGAPIGAGILIGAAATAATGLATDNFNPRAVAIGGAVGAIPGGDTIGGAFVAGATQNLASQVLIDGKGLGDLDYGSAFVSGVTGAGTAGFTGAVKKLLPTGAAGDVVPTGRTVVVDTDALVKYHQLNVGALVQKGDQVLVTPQSIRELDAMGIKNIDDFLAKRGATPGFDVAGTTVPASALRQQLDGIVTHRGNLGDALNISQAAGMKADLFVTADSNTIGRTFGPSGVISIPHSGGAKLPFVVLGGGGS